VDYGNGIETDSASWSSTGQTGLRRGNLLFLSDGVYQYNKNTQQAVRLMTSLYWERPNSISRWVAGDINATSGEPSGPIIMGGLGYASAFSMSPGLMTYPLGNFGGVTTLPSDADIYVNGVIVRREHLAPGDYRFRNLPVSNGANNVEIVMRDAFGNESRSSTRFYLSDNLLKSGLHDFSYNIGFLRRDFGSASNRYGHPLLIARHSLGLSDSFTLGAGAEAGNGLVNLIPRAVLSLEQMGVLNIMAGESHDQGFGWGTTLGIGYRFQSRYVNYQLSVNHNSRGYRTMANQEAKDTSRLDVGTGISLGTPIFGTVSLNGSFAETYSGQLIRTVGMSYSRSLAKKVQFSASWSSSWGTSSSTNFFAGLTFLPMNDLTASATLQASPDNNKETISIQKSLPVGEGIGYLATLDRERTRDRTLLRANPFFQLNGPYGSYSAEVRGESDQQNGRITGNYQISAAGSLVYAGGHIGLSRPVSGSFAIVQIEGLPAAAVMLNNQEVATTNANGMAYIPNLQSYQENRIAFDDRHIPANYLIKRYSAIVTPGLYGGECIYFPVAKIQGYGGRILAQGGLPLEFAKVTLRGMGKVVTFRTLSGGEFYFENLVDIGDETVKTSDVCGSPSPYQLNVVPGKYAATVLVNDSEWHFNMLIPSSEEMFVPLGKFLLPEPSKQK
jgi:outer membrane usher protein